MYEQGSFNDLRCWVEAMVEAGEPLDRVEEDIRDAALADEQKAALWLLAWCLSGRRRFRRRPAPRRGVPPTQTLVNR